MTEKSDQDEKRARVLTRALQGLPLKRAPGSLESRVFQELARRASLPWWRNSFMHWPLPARCGFLSACGLLAGMTLLGRPWFLAGVTAVNDSADLALSWTRPLVTLTASAGGVFGVLVHAVPAFWLYGTLIGGAVLYATLFGLSAAVYRTLYFQASEGG